MRILQTIRSSVFRRHSHEHAYAAIVLAGGYEEAGDHGRFRVKVGDVVLHERFEAHMNRFSDSGAVVFNLPLPSNRFFTPGLASIPDSDSIIQVAESNRAEAADILLSKVEAREAGFADWPDELAAALIESPCFSLSRWCATKGLRPWAVSRGFMQVFGISPSAFKARTRTRQAWKSIETSDKSLAQIAAHHGFCDQPHMTRSVRQLTGAAPRTWRDAANRFKTR